MVGLRQAWQDDLFHKLAEITLHHVKVVEVAPPKLFDEPCCIGTLVHFGGIGCQDQFDAIGINLLGQIRQRLKRRDSRVKISVH